MPTLMKDHATNHATNQVESIEADAQAFRDAFERTRREIAKVVVGHKETVEGVLVCLFAGGHCLLEGVPGLGKTLLIRSLSQALHLKFNRVQFTPDLMPADVTGTTIVVETEHGRDFQFRKDRSSPRSCWPTKSIAPRRRRNRRCLRRCKSAA